MNRLNTGHYNSFQDPISPCSLTGEGSACSDKQNRRTALHRHKGFSLVELIVSLVIVGIMSAVVYAYMGSSLTNSVFPVVWLNDAQTANSVMEQIKADYDQKFKTYPSAGWIYNFFDNEIKNASYISEVDNYEYVSGHFDGSFNWIDDPTHSSDYLKVTLTQGLQKVIAVFSE
jgi:prepilin-type N-terminal cleavage/methylation domain-containing protein